MVIDGLEFLINIFRIILFKANPIKIRMMGKYIWLISVPTSKRSKGEISHSTEDFFSKTNLWDTNTRKKLMTEVDLIMYSNFHYFLSRPHYKYLVIGYINIQNNQRGSNL